VKRKGCATDPYVWWIHPVRERGLKRELSGDGGRLLIDGISISGGSLRRLWPSFCPSPSLDTHRLLSGNVEV
jgi:hypothetical protein